jgi:hypothetical protein
MSRLSFLLVFAGPCFRLRVNKVAVEAVLLSGVLPMAGIAGLPFENTNGMIVFVRHVCHRERVYTHGLFNAANS